MLLSSNTPAENGSCKPRTIRNRSLLILALLSVVWAGLSGCGDKQAHNRAQRPPVPVDVAEVIQRDTPLYVDSIGNVVAYNTVDVRSRVTGEVIKRFFKEGDRLKKGQELFVIDPAPFMAKVKEAEAKLNQSQVQFEQSITDYHRFEGLFSEKAISQEQLENKRVDMNSKRYQVELNKAELESARLNLGYCFINSPLDGESGEIYVDNHNIVNANQDRLVTIKQTQPIKVRFSVPGKFLEQIRHHSQQGEVEVAAIPLGTEEPEKGRLTMMDNVINIRTGMIMLEGTFPNSNAKLWPGEFVRVRLRLSVTRNAVLVPTRAVMDGPEGQYVWVMNSDQKVSVRPVKIDRRNGATDVVSEGLKPGEIVITAGRLMLYPGAQVITRQQIEEIRKGRPASADGARDTKQRNEAPKS